MLSGALLVVFWALVALLGGLSAAAFLLGLGKGR